MKPFNLEEAKAGKPVCTRDGTPVRISCFDFLRDSDYPIVAIGDDEKVSSYTVRGEYLKNWTHPLDIFMAD